jgi:hypothetical protein
VAEDSTVVVEVVEEPKVVAEVVDDATDAELVVLSEVMVDDVEIWEVSDVEVDRDVNDCDVAVVDVTSVVAPVVVRVDVELATLSLVVVEAGMEVVELPVGAEFKDDETDADSIEDVSIAVVKLGISVDVTMEIEVVTTVEKGGADSVEANVGTVSVGV